MKTEKQQTAVEWLVEQITDSTMPAREAIKQAKAMEKEQHDKTAEEWWKEGAHYMESGGRAKWESFEQYYNETFIVL
jgi:N-glycosylase/DNA lyase